MPAQEVIFLISSDGTGPIARWIEAKVAAALLLVLALLVASGAACAPRSKVAAPGRCCFQVSVDVKGSFLLLYPGGKKDGRYEGSTSFHWEWHTRFIDGYTGHGLVEAGTLGEPLADVEYRVESHYARLLLKSSPRVDCEKTMGTEGTGLQPVPDRIYAIDLARATTSGPFAPRGLFVSSPVFGPFSTDVTCGSLEPPQVHIFMDSAHLKAPSAANFLHGTSFASACIERVGKPPTADDPGNAVTHNNPSPHTYSGFSIVAVQFTYIPNSDVGKGLRRLANMKGKRAVTSAAFRAAEAANNSGKAPEGTTTCK